MNKEIVDKDKLEDPKLRGTRKIAGIVKRTLGPGGLPIIIQRMGQSLDGSPLPPKITKDGVSVAEECGSEDQYEDLIIQTIKNVCKKTNKDAGDGTTTAIVLGEAIMSETHKVLNKNRNLNPQLVKTSIEAAVKDVLESLEAQTIEVQDIDKIKEVATISANGDEEIGDIIAKAFDAVGAEGVVTVDEGATNGLTLNVVDGYQFNRGTESSLNFFNNKNCTQFEAEQCAVVIFDGNIFNYTDLIPVITCLAAPDAQGRPTNKIPPILILANEFSNEVITFLLRQKQNMGLQVCPVRGPHMSHVRTGYYDDLAKYLGGVRLGNGGRSLSAIEVDDFGVATKMFSDKYKTTIYGGKGTEEDILERVDQLKAMKDAAESPYDAQVLNDRIASLTNGVAKIGVGGATELEIKEKYDRIEDALNAARAAIEEGVVPGGGTALLRASDKMDAKSSVGHAILKQALSAPFRQILDNIGLDEITIEQIAEDICKKDGIVYDARNKEMIEFIKAGIVDPVKVTKSALENAVSISTLLSTAGGAVIYNKTDK